MGKKGTQPAPSAQGTLVSSAFQKGPKRTSVEDALSNLNDGAAIVQEIPSKDKSGTRPAQSALLLKLLMGVSRARNRALKYRVDPG